MKYKVGDVVRLKSKEELQKISNRINDIADKYAGNVYKITAILGKYYMSEGVIFNDNDIYGFADGKDRFTLDELKERVEDFKSYLLSVCMMNEVKLSLNFEYCEVDDGSPEHFKRVRIKASVKMDDNMNGYMDYRHREYFKEQTKLNGLANSINRLIEKNNKPKKKWWHFWK